MSNLPLFEILHAQPGGLLTLKQRGPPKYKREHNILTKIIASKSCVPFAIIKISMQFFHITI
jgi:hypothetical protein